MLYLSLGTNLGDREANLRRAVQLIGERVGHVVACSTFHETRPVGFKSDHLFLNAAAKVECALSAEEVLRVTQQIERDMGRTAKTADGAYADRIIDIDLLHMDGVRMSTRELILPHPHLSERRFVLEPLAEIAPELVIPPRGKDVCTLLHDLNEGTIRIATRLFREDWLAVDALLRQLGDPDRGITLEDYGYLVEMTHNTRLALLYDEERRACAMATLCICNMPTGRKAWIEDVVVDKACRRRGYARQLVNYLISWAREAEASSVNLTSRPEREAANALYRSLGFKQRATNVYRLELPPEQMV